MSLQAATKKSARLESDLEEPELRHPAVSAPVLSSQTMDDKLSLRSIRDAIPDHCFHASWTTSLAYLARDLFLLSLLSIVSWTYIPTISSTALRCTAWVVYGFVQGLVFTGLWVIGHELGHGATLPSPMANDIFGFAIHSCFMTPYFAWQSTHRKHHRYTAHIDRDPNHIPLRYKDDERSDRDQDHHEHEPSILSRLHEFLEDTPLYVLSRLVFQQVLGWPMYLATSIASGETSCNYRPESMTRSMPEWLRKSHFNPIGSLFQPRETVAIILSDLGLVLIAALLWRFAISHGFNSLFLLYGQPYMWLNHWITMVTFLHHTHPEVPKYEAESWTFVKGATATIDRDFGAVGRFFFHNVIDYHVVHHLFPRIPFYHAPEATRAIRPILGKAYHLDRTSYFQALWREFTTCQWVCPDSVTKTADQALWFVGADFNISSSPNTRCSPKPRRRLAKWWKL